MSRYVTETRLELVPHKLNIKKAREILRGCLIGMRRARLQSSRQLRLLMRSSELNIKKAREILRGCLIGMSGREFACGSEPDDQRLG